MSLIFSEINSLYLFFIYLVLEDIGENNPRNYYYFIVAVLLRQLELAPIKSQQSEGIVRQTYIWTHTHMRTHRHADAGHGLQ